MEEGLGVFQRVAARIDRRLGAAGATGPGRAIRRVAGWIGRLVIGIGMMVFVAGGGVVVGTVLYLILHALGVVPAVRNNTTNWWAVIGGAVAAVYLGIFTLVMTLRERRDTRR